MRRPVRPIALTILTACMVYPGVTMLYQGLYAFVAGEYFTLVGQPGFWMNLAMSVHSPLAIPAFLAIKSLVGLLWIAGVLGLWAGDGRAYPVTLLAALGSLLFPIGPTVMSVIGLACLLGFRETESTVPA